MYSKMSLKCLHIEGGQLSRPELGTRGTDVGGTALSGCYQRPNCNFGDKFRRPDGKCNNRREVVGIIDFI